MKKGILTLVVAMAVFMLGFECVVADVVYSNTTPKTISDLFWEGMSTRLGATCPKCGEASSGKISSEPDGGVMHEVRYNAAHGHDHVRFIHFTNDTWQCGRCGHKWIINSKHISAWECTTN